MHSLSVKSAWCERIRKGYPWVYAHALVEPRPTAELGELVYLIDNKHRPLAIAYYNPSVKLACRVLSLNYKTTINEAFFQQLFIKAQTAREKRFSSPYYRFIHAEADHLPGLIIDRFNDTFVCQTNTAGMEKLKPFWISALKTLFQPKRIILRSDTPSRRMEGLDLFVEDTINGQDPLIEVQENEARYYCDPINGQKTGWFYDHRQNRAWLAQHAKNKSVLDLYCYNGGFGLLAACHLAKNVTMVDSSAYALELAKQGAIANHILPQCQFVKDNVFTLLERAIEEEQTFDIVIADPPAFVKEAKYKGQGLKGYQKLAKLAAQVVAPHGLFFIASCSHHAQMNDFRQAVETGMTKAGRNFTFLRKAGADKDHPVHPLLPETHYLKSVAYLLD